MKIQIITMGVFLAAAKGVIIPPDYGRSVTAVGPVSFPAAVPRPEELFSRPMYTYGYDVYEPEIGDSKIGGNRGIVDYIVNTVNGFNTIVRKKPAVARPGAVAPVVTRPAAVASPISVSQFGVARPTFEIGKPATAGVPVAVAAPAVAVRPPAAVFAPLRFLLRRYGYAYAHTPFAFSYNY